MFRFVLFSVMVRFFLSMQWRGTGGHLSTCIVSLIMEHRALETNKWRGISISFLCTLAPQFMERYPPSTAGPLSIYVYNL